MRRSHGSEAPAPPVFIAEQGENGDTRAALRRAGPGKVLVRQILTRNSSRSEGKITATISGREFERSGREFALSGSEHVANQVEPALAALAHEAFALCVRRMGSALR